MPRSVPGNAPVQGRDAPVSDTGGKLTGPGPAARPWSPRGPRAPGAAGVRG